MNQVWHLITHKKLICHQTKKPNHLQMNQYLELNNPLEVDMPLNNQTKPNIAQSAETRIYQLHLCRGVRFPNKCHGYDTKQSDGEVPVMLELWEMWCTFLLSSLPGLLWSGVVGLDRVQSSSQIELNCVLMLNWISWHGTVLTFKLCTYAKLNCLK